MQHVSKREIFAKQGEHDSVNVNILSYVARAATKHNGTPLCNPWYPMYSVTQWRLKSSGTLGWADGWLVRNVENYWLDDTVKRLIESLNLPPQRCENQWVKLLLLFFYFNFIFITYFFLHQISISCTTCHGPSHTVWLIFRRLSALFVATSRNAFLFL